MMDEIDISALLQEELRNTDPTLGSASSFLNVVSGGAGGKRSERSQAVTTKEAESVRRDVGIKEAVRRDVVCEEAVRRDVVSEAAVRRDVVIEEAVRRDVVEAESVRRDVVIKESVRRDVVIKEAVQRDVVDAEVVRRDDDDAESVRRDFGEPEAEREIVGDTDVDAGELVNMLETVTRAGIIVANVAGQQQPTASYLEKQRTTRIVATESLLREELAKPNPSLLSIAAFRKVAYGDGNGGEAESSVGQTVVKGMPGSGKKPRCRRPRRQSSLVCT